MFKNIAFFAFVLIIGCTNKHTSEKPLSKEEKIRYEQYYVQGQQLYNTYCSNCHQYNGQGLGKLFPPIKSSDFMHQNFEAVICLMRNGTSGQKVNGTDYSRSMPGIPTLTALEVAEIATFIYNTWGNERGYINVKTVDNILKRCQ